MKILKIVTEDYNNVEPFLNGDSEYVSEKEGLIELVVGYDLAKEKGASILEHKLDKNKYWTFLPREKRYIFKEHVKTLIKEGYENFIGKIKLKTLDPIRYESEKTFLSTISKAIQEGTGYLYSDKLYVYKKGILYHINMGLLDFMSWDIRDNIIDMVNMIDVDLENYKEDLKYIEEKYIPYLVYAEENNIIGELC